MTATGFQIHGWRTGTRIKRGDNIGVVLDDGWYSIGSSSGTWWFWILWDGKTKAMVYPECCDVILEA